MVFMLKDPTILLILLVQSTVCILLLKLTVLLDFWKAEMQSQHIAGGFVTVLGI